MGCPRVIRIAISYQGVMIELPTIPQTSTQFLGLYRRTVGAQGRTAIGDNPGEPVHHGCNIKGRLRVADTFKLGDTVRLKSGGPLMTIAGQVASDLRTIWFHDAETKEGVFPGETLEPAEPPKIGMTISRKR
jgi:uncharacterized protein YodC (DUF2158 family)